MSTLSKMVPKLNREFYYEIIKEFKGGFDHLKQNSDALSTFMLSSREAFYSTLHSFSKVDQIFFWNYGIQICVNGKGHCFAYDSKWLDFILKVSLPSIYHLIVGEHPKFEKGWAVMDKVFVENDFKDLTLYNELPRRYKSFFLNGCKFENVCSGRCTNNLLFELLLMSSKRHIISTRNFGYFVYLLSYRALPFQYLNVKYLVFYDFSFVDAPINSQQLFASLFNTSFPNLEHIEIRCDNYCLLSAIFNAFLDDHELTNEKLDGKIVFKLVERFNNVSSKWDYNWYGTISREEDIDADDNVSVVTAVELDDIDDIEDDNASIATAMETSDLDYFFAGV